MAKIGDIYLGGADSCSTQCMYNSGIGFFLMKSSKISSTLSFENGKWEVELKEGQQSIVARCTGILQEDQILKLGLKYCQQAIDFLSVEHAEDLTIEELGNFHILLYKKDNYFTLKQVQTAGVTYDISVRLVNYDINGNIVPQSSLPQPKWTTALRFYRFAQNSNDLYESYRNAFLSLECLLNDIRPIRMKNGGKPAEGERAWLKDALKTLELKYNINLIDYVSQGATDPIEDFVKSQYDDIRCKLFHAKGSFAGECPINIIVPADSFNPTEVSSAYEKLMLFVKQVLTQKYHIKFKHGVITYQGFKVMMEDNFSSSYNMLVNADDTSLNGNTIEKYCFPLEKLLENEQQISSDMELKISPKKLESDLVLNLRHDSTVSGIVKVSGKIAKNKLSQNLIYRTSLSYIEKMIRAQMIIIFYNKDGLDLGGVDWFENNIHIKLNNNGYSQK